MSKFVERLSHLKAKSGKSQSKIAADLGMRPQALSYFFHGREPSYDVLIQLADYFGVSCDYLLGHDAPEDRTTQLRISAAKEQTIREIEAAFQAIIQKVRECE